ncbi:MAG: thrombospondin type 3 repeat-containing protein [bacterium]|nr:thrombospondin type 3 repeat-containing protein [bacterium]
MFDLLEEDLATRAVEPPVIAPIRPVPHVDPLVYVMPEKFRFIQKKTSPLIIVAIILGVALLVSGILLVVIILNQPPKQSSVQSVVNEKPAVVVAPVQQLSSSTDSLSTSTASVLDVSLISSSSTEILADSVLDTATSTPSSTPSLLPLVIAVAPLPGIDSDNDHLTDAEERLFGTDQAKPDTNSNGYLDGDEVVNGYDPLRPGVKIQTATTLHTYSNTTFGYTILHPQTWIAQHVNELDREVLISSATGEFVSVKVEDNPKKLTPREWASSVAQLPITVISQDVASKNNTLSAVTTDGMSAYIVQTDAAGAVSSPIIIHVSYELNMKQELNFFSTFTMMFKSLLFIDLSSLAPIQNSSTTQPK